MPDPEFCSLCGQRLYLSQSPARYLWWRCPRWPNKGAHWWSARTAIEHDYINAPNDAKPKVYDRQTGERVTPNA